MIGLFQEMPDKANHLCLGALSRQRHKQEKHTKKGTLQLLAKLRSHHIMGTAALVASLPNRRVLRHMLVIRSVSTAFCFSGVLIGSV